MFNKRKDRRKKGLGSGTKDISFTGRKQQEKKIVLEFYWQRCSNRKQWNPENREMLKIVLFGKLAYLYGGLG